MKDQFTALLAEVVQHQVELQAGLDGLTHQAEQCGHAQSAQALRDQVAQFNARVTAFTQELGMQCRPEPTNSIKRA